MLEISKDILQKLVCTQCGGYLTHAPIMLNKENEQICGKCFKILPDDKKTNCVRQSAFETIAEMFVFPCRYNMQGCKNTFQWNQENDHEINCPYRYNTLPLEEILTLAEENPPDKKPETECLRYLNGLKLKANCENVYCNLLESDKLKLKVDVTGHNRNTLTLTNPSSSHSKDNIVLSLEFLISLENSPKITYCYMDIKNNLQEHIYEKVIHKINCANCKKHLTTEIFHCPFGHSLCKNCKGNCLICGNQSNSEPQCFCKNIWRGCTQLFLIADIKKHEIDCEFNNFNCPLHNCEFSDTINNVNDHFIQAHENLVIFSNEFSGTVTRKDQTWYFYCYNKLFCCNYYYLEDSIEFIIKYMGSNDNASKYRYEITSLPEKSLIHISKGAKCLGWNETSLEKAITYELKNGFKQKLDVHMKILQLTK